jgi:anti-sigma B factor antagonist
MEEVKTLNIPNHPEISVVELPAKVLGGSSALAFSDFVNSLKTGGFKFLVLDLRNVQLMNSSGLGMIVSAYTTLKKDSIELILINVPKKIQNLLAITHLDNIFSQYRTFEDFIATL